MKRDLLHTPEGVRDIYNGECARKSVIQERLHDVCFKYGYNDIQTPTIEFFDVFSKERGSVPSNEMFKLFDRYGNTLVLRPDMTPSIVRTAAKYYADNLLPIKLCYAGNTFINVSKYYQGKLKENTMRPRSSPMWWTAPPSHRFRSCAIRNLRRAAASGSCPTFTPGRAVPSALP